MASWDDVRRLALALPEAAERAGRDGLQEWRVKDKLFAWERPLRRGDLDALGEAAPRGPILGVRVADLGVKEALLAGGGAEEEEVYFSTPHFDGYKAILVRLDRIKVPELAELLADGWLCQAPKRVAARYLDPQNPDIQAGP